MVPGVQASAGVSTSHIALLTFGLGIMAARVGDVRVLTRRYECTRRSHPRSPLPGVVTKSPTMSFERYPDQPVELLYDSTHEVARAVGSVRVQFLFKNTNQKPIVRYTIEYLSRPASDNETLANLHRIFHGSRLQSGESETFVLTTRSDSSLSLRVNDVEFDDGTRWSSSHEH